MRYEKISDTSGYSTDERIEILEDHINMLVEVVEHLHKEVDRLRRDIRKE